MSGNVASRDNFYLGKKREQVCLGELDRRAESATAAKIILSTHETCTHHRFFIVIIRNVTNALAIYVGIDHGKLRI